MIDFCLDSPLKLIKQLYIQNRPIIKINENSEQLIYIIDQLILKNIKLGKLMEIISIICRKFKKKTYTLINIKKNMKSVKYDNICRTYTSLRIVNYIMNK